MTRTPEPCKSSTYGEKTQAALNRWGHSALRGPQASFTSSSPHSSYAFFFFFFNAKSGLHELRCLHNLSKVSVSVYSVIVTRGNRETERRKKIWQTMWSGEIQDKYRRADAHMVSLPVKICLFSERWSRRCAGIINLAVTYLERGVKKKKKKLQRGGGGRRRRSAGRYQAPWDTCCYESPLRMWLWLTRWWKWKETRLIAAWNSVRRPTSGWTNIYVTLRSCEDRSSRRPNSA